MKTPPLRRWRFGLRQVLGSYPRVFLPVARLRRLQDSHPLSPWPVDSRTEIVIEGFPRSGNTFSIAAFSQSQQRRVAVAHHLHVPAQILSGVRRKIPVILLVRDPAEAVVSMKIREPYLSFSQLLWSYARFHRELVAVGRDRMLIADFTDVTTNFGKVMQRVNEQFGSTFGVFEHTEKNVDLCFRLIEERNRALSGGTVKEQAIARPSTERSGLKAELIERLTHSEFAQPLEESRSLYESLLAR